jgi:nicotinate phosphoribosyltransferase
MPETYLLAAVSFQTLIATKAARMVAAAGGRPGGRVRLRAARTLAEAGVLGARAAYIGGCAATSNTLAGFRYSVSR